MIGIKFEIPNGWGNYLDFIIKDINTDGLIWKISDEEILMDRNDNQDLFNKEFYNNQDFRNIIVNNKYYLIFGNIAAFKSFSSKDIYCYEDFKNSDCEILINVIDSSFINIYAKREKILEQLSQNAINYNFQNIEYIYNN